MSSEPNSPDPSFPQLGVALDPELMREVFQKHLRPLGKKAYLIRECRISRMRHRQGLSCILQYHLRLEQPGTGRERIEQVTGVVYAGDRTRRTWERVRRSEPGREISDASPAFAPFSYVPELDMLVQVFPYDHRLPALPLLVEGPPPELEPLLLDRFGPGDWQLEAWDAEPARYLAGARATLRLTARAREAATGRTQERHFFAKVYHKDEQGEQTHQVLRALWEKAEVGGAGFTVARPIAYLSGLGTLVQEEVPGIPLKDVLIREDQVTQTVRKVARALAVLHLYHDDAVMPQPRLSWKEREVATLERIGRLLQLACPRQKPQIEETVGAVTGGFEEVPLAPTHGDLKLAHVFLDGDRLALVDLDSFAKADPVLDAALFSAILANATPLLPHGRAWAAAQVFVEEYFARVPEAWRTRLPLHYAGALLKTAGATFRRQAPGWPEKVEGLLEEAKNSLAGRVW